MPRIRSIKPEFWTSEQIVECSPIARLLFIGLWNFCDDEGRHKFSVKTIKAEVFPADDLSVDAIRALLDELIKNDLIVPYTHGNQQFFYVSGWHHQKIDRPQKPKHPNPFDEHSTIGRRAFAPDRIGEDRIGEDPKKKIPQNPSEAEQAAIERQRKEAIDREFDEQFWPMYPHRVGKADARSRWHRQRRDHDCATIIAGLEHYIATNEAPSWLHPSTFLNKQRFLDDPNDTGAGAGNDRASSRPDTVLAALAKTVAPKHPDSGRPAAPPGRNDDHTRGPIVDHDPTESPRRVPPARRRDDAPEGGGG